MGKMTYSLLILNLFVYAGFIWFLDVESKRLEYQTSYLIPLSIKKGYEMGCLGARINKKLDCKNKSVVYLKEIYPWSGK